jgi:hypothetical protein
MQVQPNFVPTPSTETGDASRPSPGAAENFGAVLASSMSTSSSSASNASDSKAVSEPAQNHSTQITTPAKANASPETKLELRLALKANRKNIAGGNRQCRGKSQCAAGRKTNFQPDDPSSPGCRFHDCVARAIFDDCVGAPSP